MNEIRKVELFNVDLKHNGDNDMTLIQRDLENQEIGMKKRDREKIADMLKKGKTPEAIADFCDYPMELIREVEKFLFT